MLKTNPKNSNKKFSLIIFITIIIFIVTVASYIAYVHNRNFKEQLVNQWKNQLLTTANISSLNIENFINKYSENLIYTSHNPSVKKILLQNDSIEIKYCCLEKLYEIHKKDVDAILLLDSNCCIIKRFPFWQDGVNRIGQKCHVEFCKENKFQANKTYVSNVFSSKLNEKAITIYCPVYFHKDLIGLIRWMINVKTISDKFIKPVKLSKEGYMWCIDNSNTIISHPDENIIGQRVDDVLKNKINDFKNYKINKNQKETFDFFKTLTKEKNGFGESVDFLNGEKSLAVFKTVKIGNKSWKLIINIPYSEINKPIIENAKKTYSLVFIIIFFILVISFWFYSIQKKKNKLEFETKHLLEIAQASEKLEDERNKRFNAVIDGQEKERKRISRELHDGLGQMLLAIKVKLEDINLTKKNKALNIIDDVKNISLKTIVEIKRISDNLTPGILYEFGIVTSLKKLCENFTKTDSVKIDFVSYGVDDKMDDKIITYIYRIAQEAISNIIKHADASEVNVQLLGNKNQLNLVIHDNGKGFLIDDKTKFKGNGLNNMRERVSILSGEIDINSIINQGTEIKIKIPLKKL